MSQQDDAQKPKEKGPRWMRILLVGSLALNLAVVGVLAGTAYRAKGKHWGKSAPPPSLSVTVFRAMDRETRHKLMREAAGEHPDLRAQRRADRAALLSAMRTEPFDVEAVATVLDGQAQRQFEFRQRLRQSWFDQLSRMSDDERAELLERLEKDDHHRFKGGKYGKHGD